MARLSSNGGFELETTPVGNTILCVCRRNCRARAVEVRCGWPDDPAQVQTERLELMARNFWFAAERDERRGQP